MPKSLLLVAFLVSLLMCVCVIEGPSPLETNPGVGLGAIKGVVVGPDSTWFPNGVQVRGTNIPGAMPDSAGRFLLLGVPAGTYTVSVSFYSYDDRIGGYGLAENEVEATVTAGDTTDLGRISDSTSASLCSRWPVEYMIFRADDSTAISAPRAMFEDTILNTTIVRTNADSVFVGAAPLPEFGSISIIYHGDTLCNNCSPKSRISRGNLVLIRRSGNDTVFLASSAYPGCPNRLVLLDSTSGTGFNRVYLTTGAVTASLSPCAATSYRTIVQGDTVCLSINNLERIDWDIYFVNDSTHDSCWYGNSQARATWLDNSGPSFRGDECSPPFPASTSWEGLSCQSYTADQLTLYPSNGSYSVVCALL